MGQVASRHYPPLPKVNAEVDLVAMKDASGIMHLIDPALPTDLKVTDVLGEQSTSVAPRIEIDGGDIFSANPDGSLSGHDAQGNAVTYNKETKKWEQV